MDPRRFSANNGTALKAMSRGARVGQREPEARREEAETGEGRREKGEGRREREAGGQVRFIAMLELEGSRSAPRLARS
eukprot:10964-Rhodomonas_salina.1